MPHVYQKQKIKFHHIQAMKFGGNDWAITLSLPWGFIKVNNLSLPLVTLKILFVRFSFSPFCVKTTIPLSSFVSSWFISFFTEACFSSCKTITKLYSLLRRPHSFGLYSHSGMKYFNSLIMNVFIKKYHKFLNQSIYFWLAFENYCFHGHT